MGFLALCDGEAVEPTVICGCAPLRQKEVQAAGNAFFDKFERKAGSDGSDSKEAAGQDGSGSDDEYSPSKPKKKKEKKDQEALKLAECLKGEDLYELLEVDAGASQDDLKKAYRKICLVHHPDKHSDKTGAELEAVNLHFVKLQEAFSVLSDVKKRRKYDSMGEFDDSVPKALKENQDFFEVFDPVFRRNAKWSERKPVPELGDASTPYEKVKSFYDFWFSFESWRDLDELIREENGEDCFQDLEEAESRDEKRWMERENARIRGKYMKAERQRIFGFVELAEKHDPRVKAEKDKQHAAKEAAKAAKAAAKEAEERLAREEQERKAREEEEAARVRAVEKAQREEEKKVRKAARTKLRKMVKDLELGLAEDPLQEFLLALEPEETDKLMDELKKGGKGEAVFAAMKSKGVEPVILSKEDEKSTEEGSTSEEQTPQEIERQRKAKLEKQKLQEARQKKQDEEDKKLREAEAEKRAEEKAVRDVKKKAEQEKKDREQQKANKKEQEKLKRDQEKKVKDEAKAVEQARLEKEANTKRSEEQRQKQLAEKREEEEARLLERRTFEFERDRLARCEAFDKLTPQAVVEASQAAAENPITASGLAAAAAAYEDAEDLLDAQLACLGSFFVLGKRPAEDALALSSGLRARVKKLRTKIRGAAAAGEWTLTAPANTEADSEALEQMMLASNGDVQHPADVQRAAEAAAAAPQEDSPAKSGKKAKQAKAKAAPGDEDLDALLAEFDMGPSGGDKKKKGGKKK